MITKQRRKNNILLRRENFIISIVIIIGNFVGRVERSFRDIFRERSTVGSQVEKRIRSSWGMDAEGECLQKR